MSHEAEKAGCCGTERMSACSADSRRFLKPTAIAVPFMFLVFGTAKMRRGSAWPWSDWKRTNKSIGMMIPSLGNAK
jgi:hypothetical protein